jgi:hypothetical protein
LIFFAPIWVKFGQFGKNSANLDDIRPKSVAEIRLRAFDRFGQKNITVYKKIRLSRGVAVQMLD